MARKYSSRIASQCITELQKLKAQMQDPSFIEFLDGVFVTQEADKIKTQLQNKIIAPIDDLIMRLTIADQAMRKCLPVNEQRQYEYDLIHISLRDEKHPRNQLNRSLDQVKKIKTEIADIRGALGMRYAEISVSRTYSIGELDEIEIRTHSQYRQHLEAEEACSKKKSHAQNRAAARIQKEIARLQEIEDNLKTDGASAAISCLFQFTQSLSNASGLGH